MHLFILSVLMLVSFVIQVQAMDHINYEFDVPKREVIWHHLCKTKDCCAGEGIIEFGHNFQIRPLNCSKNKEEKKIYQIIITPYTKNYNDTSTILTLYKENTQKTNMGLFNKLSEALYIDNIDIFEQNVAILEILLCRHNKKINALLSNKAIKRQFYKYIKDESDRHDRRFILEETMGDKDNYLIGKHYHTMRNVRSIIPKWK